MWTGRSAYVVNAGTNIPNISAYTINRATGALTPIPGSPFAAPGSITVHPTGRFAYVTGGNNISVYSINSTGALTAIPDSAIVAGTSPTRVAVDPSGRFAYTANYGSNNVSAYTINSVTGAPVWISYAGQTSNAFQLASVATAPGLFTQNSSGSEVARRFAALGLRLVATPGTAAALRAAGLTTRMVFKVNEGRPAVPGSPFAAGAYPFPVAVDPTGQLAYVPNSGSNNVSAYTINSATGALTPVPGSPFAVAGPTSGAVGPTAVTVDPTGQFAYVAVYASLSYVSAYAINPATGALAAVPGSPVATADYPHSIVTTSPAAPLPTITAVVNAASYANSSVVSPGEIVTIFGTNIGPATPAGLAIDPTTGKVATLIGGVQVLFNGVPAPMVYDGPGSILNQDNSVNGPNNPATKGSIVQAFMTGEGQTSPLGVTGTITAATLPPPQVTPAPLLSAGVLIDGQPALYTYVGEAPGMVAGVMQLNVQIPSNAPSGNLPITVLIGGNTSQNNVTVSVK
jgi:6-phosphogluconolactonase (cycloisomerase 2 family)